MVPVAHNPTRTATSPALTTPGNASLTCDGTLVLRRVTDFPARAPATAPAPAPAPGPAPAPAPATAPAHAPEQAAADSLQKQKATGDARAIAKRWFQGSKGKEDAAEQQEAAAETLQKQRDTNDAAKKGTPQNLCVGTNVCSWFLNKEAYVNSTLREVVKL